MAFESILCRLRLAQLLLKPFSSLLHSSLGVVDYTFSKAVVKHVDEAQLREFFFGHRSAPKLLTSREGPPVRWVHMQKFNLTLMLALTVKYSLHPLSVEDVIEQCPTKIDRFGRNYFLAVELLIVDDGSLGPSSQGQGQVPVRVRGQHVTAFCSGPPSLDTLLTLVQTDRNFDKDWPGGLGGVEEPEVSSHKVGTSGVLPPASAWPEKLRQRLLAARSRLRERRADFLLYTVVDLCADELVTVARAYLARLAWLEEDLRSHGHGDRSLLDLGEVSLARLQLAVVARRLRSLQRVVRRASEYGDLHTTGSADYWKAAHEQVMERGQSELVHLQNEEHKLQAERMNFLLFFLTVGTTFFTPLTFMSSVYGMNFTDPETGMSAIPELLTPNGYKFFWLGVVAYLVVAATVASCLYRRLNRKREKRAVPAQSGCANCASCLYSTSSSCGCGRNMRPNRPCVSSAASDLYRADKVLELPDASLWGIRCLAVEEVCNRDPHGGNRAKALEAPPGDLGLLLDDETEKRYKALQKKLRDMCKLHDKEFDALDKLQKEKLTQEPGLIQDIQDINAKAQEALTKRRQARA
ncbi:unnamed protein product [Polarella glacialis]|uniref:Magnesium transporter n=1 Tax=Polarella glacialis TaxID=89957 RepID=A0A813DAI8_POLGL|nr:unnamed protein product [Polarella glacialis]